MSLPVLWAVVGLCCGLPMGTVSAASMAGVMYFFGTLMS